MTDREEKQFLIQWGEVHTAVKNLEKMHNNGGCAQVQKVGTSVAWIRTILIGFIVVVFGWLGAMNASLWKVKELTEEARDAGTENSSRLASIEGLLE